ncbi:MAG: hypothetical protein K0S41_849 [Anaerocolumna sp.]|jgi:hypothetical protein|nr:hypothetical protein [Anaerocolumna sp.]
MDNKKVKKIALSLIAFVAVIAVMFVLYNQFKPKAVEGSKKIVAEVIQTDGSSKSFDIQTDAEFLRQALEEINLISGSESDYGLMVTTVDGVTANDANQEWWCFTLNGQALNTGVDSTPINDGDHYEITLTVGY